MNAVKMLTKRDIEKYECQRLAPYAMKSGQTQGRLHKEKEHAYRTVYQRDKDRIIYSTAFRRLEYKTQVFVNHEGDYYRTRLTHTIEVAQIARTIARVLRLNEDLVEAIALAHDLGHTPFGHAGEDALAELMKNHGGFDHNTHGLRVVDVLEKRSPLFPGLNLSHEIRRGIIRHATPFDKKRQSGFCIQGPHLLEIQVVDIADEVAYDNHDLDDGLKSGFLSEDDLSGVPMWSEAERRLKKNYKNLSQEIKRSEIIRFLINAQVTDIVENTLKSLERSKIRTLEDLDSIKKNIVGFSRTMNSKRRLLKTVLEEKLYKHYRVVRMTDKAARFLKILFRLYVDNPEQLPPQAFERIKKYGKETAICDYIAGMTDRYALDQYKKFFEPYERV